MTKSHFWELKTHRTKHLDTVYWSVAGLLTAPALQWLHTVAVRPAASSFHVKVHWEGHFLQCRGMRKKAAGREENGYLYLLALELPTQILGGFLTQCSTNWCSWRSGRVIHSLWEGDIPHLSAQRVLIQRLLLEAVSTPPVSDSFWLKA